MIEQILFDMPGILSMREEELLGNQLLVSLIAICQAFAQQILGGISELVENALRRIELRVVNMAAGIAWLPEPPTDFFEHCCSYRELSSSAPRLISVSSPICGEVEEAGRPIRAIAGRGNFDPLQLFNAVL